MTFSDTVQRWVSYFVPGAFLFIAATCHVVTALLHPWLLLTDFSAYKEKAFALVWFIGGPICAQDTPPFLAPIPAQSRGVILDVGPGAGHQLFRFKNLEGIQKIYGVEPGVSLHDSLKRRAAEVGLGEKYIVLSCGAGLEGLLPELVRERVLKADVGGGKGATEREMQVFDEIVCIRVLCGVDDLDGVVQGLYSLLKKGGRMVMCEHVVCSATGIGKKGGSETGMGMGRLMQRIYMALGWSAFVGGCELDRDILSVVRQVAKQDGGWESVDVDIWDEKGVTPHVVGTLVKRK